MKVRNPSGDILPTIYECIKDKRDDIANIIHSLLSKSLSEIRELMKLKSILSYRDVKRFMQFFIHFFRKLVNNSPSNINPDTLLKNIIPRSIVLSIMISIVFRFSDNSKIETCDGFLSESTERDEEIFNRCRIFGLKFRFSKDNKHYFLNIRSALLKMLTELEWTVSIPKPENWFQVVLDYSWLKCSKYIYDAENGYAANFSLFKLNSLMTHLFAILSCYSASKNDEGSIIPCLIIGMPGTSKTLAIQLFTHYKKEKSRHKNKFFTTRISEAECLYAQLLPRLCELHVVQCGLDGSLRD